MTFHKAASKSLNLVAIGMLTRHINYHVLVNLRMVKHCYKCKSSLIPPEAGKKANTSEEHIILNALGGRLKSKDLLCKPCNDELGSRADAALAKQLQSLSSLLQIKRQAGSTKDVTGTTDMGEKYILKEGYKPSIAFPVIEREPIAENAEKIRIVAGDKMQMKKVLNNFKKKLPAFDVDDAMSKLKMKQEYLREPIMLSLQVGGEPAFASIAKSAINFFIFNGGEEKYIEHLLPYIAGSVESTAVQHANQLGLVYELADTEVFHLLHLVGTNTMGLLYCYVEFYNVFSFIVVLSKEYRGKDMKHTYACDPVNGVNIVKNASLELSPDDIVKIENEKIERQWPLIIPRFQRVMQIVDKKHTDIAISGLTKRVADKVFSKYPEGTPVTQEMLWEYTTLLAQEFIKFQFRNHDPKS